MQDRVKNKSLHFKEAIAFGWDVSTSYIGFFIGIEIVAIAIIGFISFVLSKIPLNCPLLTNTLQPSVVFVVTTIMTIGFIRIILAFCDGQSPSFGTLFNASGRFWRYLGVLLLVMLIFIVAFLIPISLLLLATTFGIDAQFLRSSVSIYIFSAVMAIPILYLQIKLIFSTFFVIDAGLGPVAAIRASSRATKSVMWRLFFFMTFCKLINLAGALCCFVGLFLTIPLTTLAFAYVYRHLTSHMPEIEKLLVGRSFSKPKVPLQEPCLVQQNQPRRMRFLIWILLCGGLLIILAIVGVTLNLSGSGKPITDVASHLFGSEKPVTELDLTGILYSETDPSLALVGTKIIREGDIVDGVKVTKIFTNRVQFEKNGKVWEQKIQASGIEALFADLFSKIRSKTNTSSASLPLLLVLETDRCPACRMMQPVLRELRVDYRRKLQVKSINLTMNRTAAQKYNVRSVPTLIFYNAKGKEIFRHSGFLTEEEILAEWKRQGVNLREK